MPMNTEKGRADAEKLVAITDRHGEAPVPVTHARSWRWWDGEDGRERVRKLEQAYLIGATDRAAVLFAGITLHQLYYWQKEIEPDFAARKEVLKDNPVLIALRTVANAARTDPHYATWLLERRLPAEYGPKVTVRNDGVSADSLKQTLDALAAITGTSVTTETNDEPKREAGGAAPDNGGDVHVGGEASNNPPDAPGTVPADTEAR